MISKWLKRINPFLRAYDAGVDTGVRRAKSMMEDAKVVFEEGSYMAVDKPATIKWWKESHIRNWDNADRPFYDPSKFATFRDVPYTANERLRYLELFPNLEDE